MASRADWPRASSRAYITRSIHPESQTVAEMKPIIAEMARMETRLSAAVIPVIGVMASSRPEAASTGSPPAAHHGSRGANADTLMETTISMTIGQELCRGIVSAMTTRVSAVSTSHPPSRPQSRGVIGVSPRTACRLHRIQAMLVAVWASTSSIAPASGAPTTRACAPICRAATSSVSTITYIDQCT